MSRVSLSVKHARALLNLAEHFHWVGEPNAEAAAEALRAALAPPPKSSAVRKTETKRRSKHEETRAIYDLVAERAAGRCEACGLRFSVDGPELDHFWGRGKAQQATENCWLLDRACHLEKTDNRPTAAYWLERFIIHATKHGYAAEVSKAQARLAFVRARGGGA